MPENNNGMKIPLHDYQVFAKNFMLSHPYCGLFLKMGLGKTSIVLEGLYELDPHCHVLIVAPKTIARCTWVNEIAKWDLPLRTKSLVVNERGKDLTKAKREEIYDSIPAVAPTIFFINREKIPGLVKRFPGKKWPFGIVIIDESQSFKSYSSERFKALKSVRPYIERLVELTGSPAPKSLEDIWAQIWLLDMGQRLGKYITNYRNQYFRAGLTINGHPVEWIPRPGAEEAIYEKISDIAISMRNKYIKLPPLTFNDVYIDMLPSEYDRYKTFMKTNVLDLANGDTIEAANAAVLSAKLSQMASGSIYTDPVKHEYELIHTHKLEFCDYIAENTDDNIIIAYHFKSELDMLVKYFDSVGKKATIFDGSPEMELAWNRKEIPILLIQPASCGFGLNLQEGGSTLIWYTLPWSLEEYEQTIARIYRQGQTNPCVIHRLMTKKTIDTRIMSALEKKDISQQQLIEAIEATVNED